MRCGSQRTYKDERTDATSLGPMTGEQLMPQEEAEA